MVTVLRARAFAALAARAAIASLLASAPAAAQGMFPLLGSSVPEQVRPLMQKPAGVSFISVNAAETLKVGNFGLVLGGQPVPPGMVSLDTVTHTTHIAGVAADLWLLPFLNVHGMVGRMWGSASDINPTVMPGLLPPGVTIPPTQNYKGTTCGGGLTFAVGYQRAFASYDISYIISTVDLLDSLAEAMTQAVRAGVRLGSGKYRATLYGGASYESIKSTLTGTGLIPGLEPDFSLTVAPRSAWTPIAGASIELTARLVVTAEAAFGNRRQLVIMPGVRF